MLKESQYFSFVTLKKSSVQNIQVFFGQSDKPKNCDRIQNDYSKYVMFNLARNVPQRYLTKIKDKGLELCSEKYE